MACKVENSGNAVSLITVILVPRLFSTVISRSKRNVLGHLTTRPTYIQSSVCLDPRTAKHARLWIQHTSSLFICLLVCSHETSRG